jgi:hypothetical protein
MQELLAKLEAALKLEERLYQKLLVIMSQEQEAVEKFVPDEVAKLTPQREELLIDVATAVDARIQIQNSILELNSIEPGENARLSEVIDLIPTESLRKRWQTRVSKFRKQAEQVQIKATELNRLVGWSMSVVGGSLSIIRSASEEKISGYNRQGAQSASYHPKYDRNSLNLKEV